MVIKKNNRSPKISTGNVQAEDYTVVISSSSFNNSKQNNSIYNMKVFKLILVFCDGFNVRHLSNVNHL